MEIKTVKHTIDLDWKAFKVWMPDLELWLKSNAGLDYAGNSADSKLHLHFTEMPSQQIQDIVHQYWDGLTEAEETAKMAHQHKIDSAIAYAKGNLVYMSWDSMIPAERKLQQGAALSLQDKEDILAKYPNV